MTAKEQQSTEEEGKGVESASVLWLLALIVLMMGFLMIRLYILQPKMKKYELSEDVKYCLEKLRAYDVREALERGGCIRFSSSEFNKKMRDCKEGLRIEGEKP